VGDFLFVDRHIYCFTRGVCGVGYTVDDRNQVWLSVQQIVLQKSLVNLRVPVVSQA